MIDSYGREINYLRVSVTDRCNLRCQYCMKEEGIELKSHREILSYEEFYRIIQCAVKLGIKKVRITGGEPLVRKNILFFLQQLSKIEGIEELCLTTNGTYLKQYAKDLKEAHVSRINVSLDTLDAEKYKKMTRGGRLDDVIEGIKMALPLFEKIKINVVYMKGFNDDEVEHFIQLTKKYPIDVRFIELMPIGEAKQRIEQYESLQNILDHHPELHPYAKDGVSVLYQLKDAQGCVGFIRPMSHSFCSSCNRIRLTADGKLKTCLFSMQEIDLTDKSDEELYQLFNEGIKQKPQSKSINQMTSRKMNEIGG